MYRRKQIIIGYARVSTIDQNLDWQIHLLTEYGCKKVIQEKFTGTIRERQGLINLFDVTRKGDTIVVESISLLGRKTLDILRIIQQYVKRHLTSKMLFAILQSTFEIPQ